MIIAIDGPAGSGKSTVARELARRLGFKYIETGSMYRAVAWKALQREIPADDVEAVARVAQDLHIEFVVEPDGQRILADGEDLTGRLKTEIIGRLAATVAANPRVRNVLVPLQQAMGRDGDVVMDGRDIGTVVFPDAEAKIFLTASVDVRAGRRHRELLDQGGDPRLDQVRDEVMERDRRDTERPVAPLRQAPDAVLIDSSALGIEEVVRRVVDHVKNVELSLSGATS